MEISKIESLTAELDHWKEVWKLLNEWKEIIAWKDYDYVKRRLIKIKYQIKKEVKND